MNGSYRLGRAYRHGDLACERIALSSHDDDRIGLAPMERQQATIRFLDPPADPLGNELTTLVRRRGAAARRVAECLEPIELVFDASDGPRRMAGRLEPPLLRSGALRDIEFGIRLGP